MFFKLAALSVTHASIFVLSTSKVSSAFSTEFEMFVPLCANPSAFKGSTPKGNVFEEKFLWMKVKVVPIKFFVQTFPNVKRDWTTSIQTFRDKYLRMIINFPANLRYCYVLDSFFTWNGTEPLGKFLKIELSTSKWGENESMINLPSFSLSSILRLSLRYNCWQKLWTCW